MLGIDSFDREVSVILQFRSIFKRKMVVVWFRRDLRWHDQHALFEAFQSGKKILPLFIFDKDILNRFEAPADPRINFIHSTLKQMWKDSEQRFLVKYGTPLETFQSLLKDYEIEQVYVNRDYEPSAIKRDEVVAEYLAGQGVSFLDFKDQVIFEKNEVVKNDGLPYTVYTPYKNKWLEHFNSEENIKPFESEKALKQLVNYRFDFPSLEKIGQKESEIKIPEYDISKSLVSNYEEYRNIPAKKGTTDLGIYLRFGVVSIREMIAKTKSYSQTLLQEFIWREFFMQILFHFPHVVENSFKEKYDRIQWRNNEEEFKKWCKGKTGYPIVDAGMRQLNQTGRMHNRVRMITASFLVKHLLIDWRWGEAYFSQKLLDYELSANNGNWQWAAGCGCDAAPYFRVFNPYEQHKKFDPKSEYIRKWVPEFELPGYPKEMVEHKAARLRALDHYKQYLNS